MRTRVHRPDDGDLSFDQPTDTAGVAPPRAVPPYVPTMSAPAPSYSEDVFGFGDDFVDVGESAAITAHDASAVASTGAEEEHELELDCEEKTEMRDSMYSVKMAIKLQDHVDSVRQEVKEERREAKELNAEKMRAMQREQREQARQNRLKMLADSADARANPEGD